MSTKNWDEPVKDEMMVEAGCLVGERQSHSPYAAPLPQLFRHIVTGSSLLRGSGAGHPSSNQSLVQDPCEQQREQ